MRRTPFIDYSVAPGQLKLLESSAISTVGKEIKRGRILGGPCGFTEKPTENGRTYINDLWRNVIADEHVQYWFENRLMLGEADHPPGDDLESSVTRTSHIMLGLKLEADKNMLYGELEIIPTTPCGQIVDTLVDYGWVPGVSSRGGGEEIRRGGRPIINPDNYFYYCHDIVVDPSCGQAARITESSGIPKALRTLVESRYHTFVSNDGDYDYFGGILDRFGVHMEQIRESVGDKRKTFVGGIFKEASTQELQERVNDLSTELAKTSSIDRDHSTLVESHRALLEEHNTLLVSHDRLLEQRRRDARRVERLRSLKEKRISGNGEKHGDTIADEACSSGSSGRAKDEENGHTMTESRSNKGASDKIADDFSDMDLTSNEETKFTENSGQTARMCKILSKVKGGAHQKGHSE